MAHLKAFQRKVTACADAALISSPQNQFYLSSFDYTDGYLLILEDAAYLLTDGRYVEAAQGAKVEGFEIILPQHSMLSAVKDLLKKHRVSTLLVEENHLSLGLYQRMTALFEGVELKSGASAILAKLRERKDPIELATIAEAQKITDAAFSHILTYLHPGVRELDVALELNFFMLKNGADGLAFDTIAVSGNASSLPHGVPRDCPLENGFLTMDFGARYGGYCSDMTRTVSIGPADDGMREVYETVRKAQAAAYQSLKIGLACRDADAAARNLINEAGYRGTFCHALGHGVGIDIHEAPRLSAAAPETDILAPGNVVTLEPGIYLPGRYGCRIEDMVAVNEDGSIHTFTASTKELIEIR